MKKTAILGVFLIVTGLSATAQKKPNSCEYGSSTTCYLDTVFSLSITPTSPILCTGIVSTIQGHITTNCGALHTITTNEECDVSETFPALTNTVILTNWWMVTGPATTFTNIGSGLNATFPTTGVGTGHVSFHIVYSNGPPCVKVVTNNITNTFTVVEVASLAPSNDVYAVEVNIGDPNYRTFAVQRVDGEDPFSHVTVFSTPNPFVTPQNLPSCWSQNGLRTNRSFVDITVFGTNIVWCTAGTSAKTNAIIVMDAAYIIQQPASLAVAVGTRAPFEVTAIGTALHYQWFYNSSAIAGATNLYYEVPHVQTNNAGTYFVVVSNLMGSATGSNAVLRVGFPPAITAGPVSRTNNASTTATFSVGATGSSPLSYHWRKGGNNLSNGGNVSGAATTSLTLSSVQSVDEGSYDVVVTNAFGVATSTPPATLTVIIPPQITTQPSPATQTVVQGSNAVVTVVATGTAPLSYQWKFNGANIAGATANSYTRVNVQTSDAGSYSVVITNTAGSVTSSTPATITVIVPPTISSQPASQTVVKDSAASFSVSAAGTTPLHYQWYRNTTNALANATNASFSITSSQPSDAGSYSVVITNVAGTITSTAATLTVNVPPSVSGPQSTNVIQGQTAVFAVTASGTTPLSYQWRFNGTAIANATTSIYSIAVVQATDQGSYTAVVTNVAGSATSAAGVLTVTVPAVITAQPSSQTVAVSSNGTFVVQATGTPAPTYQWLSSGSTISAATTSSYSTTNAGTYSVVVSNAGGTLTSVAATLTVVSLTNLVVDGSSPFIQGSVTNLLGSVVLRALAYPPSTPIPSGFPIWIVTKPDTTSSTNIGGATFTLTNSVAGQYTVTARCGSSSVSFNLLSVDPNADSDYDGVTDWQEILDGTLPNDPTSVQPRFLGTWLFNNTNNWLGLENQAPVTFSNIVGATGVSSNGVRINSASHAVLVYREAETNMGVANINCRNGSVEFWFSPDWDSGSSGGPQTGEARLLEVGTKGTANGCWGLYLNNRGTNLYFCTQTNNGAIITNFNANISWFSNYWHHIALTYSLSNSCLYIDGTVCTNGWGVSNWPSLSTRTNGFCIGSSRNGTNQACGRFDNFGCCNYPQSSNDVSTTYTTTCFTTLDAMLVIDRSGSMGDTNSGTAESKLADAKIAASNFVSHLDFTLGDRAGLVSFNTSATLNQALTNSKTPVIKAITNLTATGNTTISNGIILAQTKLTGTSHGTNALPVMVLLSDGSNQPQSTFIDQQTVDAATSAKNAGIRIVSIALGNGADTNLLQKLASGTNLFYYATNSSQLLQIYDLISGLLCRTSNSPPMVTITNPVNNQLFNGSSPGVPPSITVYASAIDPESQLAPVQFYWGLGTNAALATNSLGAGATVPYHVPWNSAPSGTNTLVAIATSGTGLSATSAPVYIRVNYSPVIGSLSNQTIILPDRTNATLAHSVTDDGMPLGRLTNSWSSIAGPAGVTFVNGLYFTNGAIGSSLSVSTNSVANFTTFGTYTLGLMANDGAVINSSNCVVIVKERPFVSITVPLEGAVLSITNPVKLNAVAYDLDGVVTNLQFLANGSVIPGNVAVGAGSTNFTLQWTNAAPGTNIPLTAIATDNDGLMQTSLVVHITIVNDANQPPTVAIITPPNNAQEPAPARLLVQSVARDDQGVTRVDYTMNGAPIGSSTASPYPLLLTNLAAGTYVFQATAFDAQGLSGSSTLVTNIVVPQPPTVHIFTPLSNDVFVVGANVLIGAEATDADGTVTGVQFLVGSTVLGTVAVPASNDVYYITWTNAAQTSPSTNLTAIATDNDGLKATSLVSIVVQNTCVSSGVSNLLLSTSVVLAGSEATGTVVLSNAAMAGGEVVQLSSSDPGVEVPVSVFIPAGSTTAVFAIDTSKTIVGTVVSVITARYHQSVVTASLVVTPDTTIGGSGHTPGTLKWSSLAGAAIDSSPAISRDGTIYITAKDGQLYSMNPNTGVTNWVVNVNNTAFSTRLCPSPAIAADGTIYVCSSDGNLYAVNPDGTFKWNVPTPLGDPSEGACTPAIGSDGTIYATIDDVSFLWAISPDGTIKWTFDCEDDIESSPAIGADCDTVYFWTGGDESGLPELFAVSSAGEVKWHIPTALSDDVYDYGFAPVIGPDGTVFLSAEPNANYLLAINPDGTTKWESEPVNNWIVSCPALDMNGNIYFGCADGNLYCVSPIDGHIQWSFTTGGGINSSPAIALDGTIYIGSTDGKLYSINPNHTTNWTYTTGAAVNSSPVIASDGTVFFGSDDSTLYGVYGTAALANSGWAMFCKNVSHTESQCLPPTTPIANVVYVRDDLVTNYTPILMQSPSQTSIAQALASFPLNGIGGTVSHARFQRAGALAIQSGSHFDLELGVASTKTNASSFGILFANADATLSAPYGLEWDLPSVLCKDAETSAGGLYGLDLTNRVSSTCGNTYSIADQPEQSWPWQKNLLTLGLVVDRLVPAGRCRDFVLNGIDVPANGTWDIRLGDHVIASSGNPNGWDVEPDYTVFGGVNLTTPTNAVAQNGYEVRANFPGWNTARSTVFAVLPRGSIPTAPTMMPLRLSTNLITSSASVTVTATLDAPASFGGATIPVYSNGTPAFVIVIPTGQTTGSVNWAVDGTVARRVDLFASYNGFRKAAVSVVSGSCTKPSAVTTLNGTATPSSVVLTWDPVAGATGYNVNRSDNCSNFTTLFQGLTTTRYVDTEVVPPTQYCYNVTVISNGCISDATSNTIAYLNPQTPPPLILPFGGRFNDSVNVLLTNSILGTTTIYYTTNGTQPNFSSDSFVGSGTITLSNSATIRAFANNPNYSNPSRTIAADFLVAKPVPITCNSTLTNALSATNSSSIVQGEGFYSSRFSFTAMSGDVGKIITITTHSTDFDTVLFLNDDSTNVLVFNDDASDDTTDSQIGYQIPEAGVYIIEVTSYNPFLTGSFSVQLTCQSLATLAAYTNAYPVFTTNSERFVAGGSIDFGIVGAGVSTINYLTLTNPGSSSIVVSNIVAYPAAATNSGNGFSISPTNVLTLAPGDSTNLAITFFAAGPSQYSGYFAFLSNDGRADNSPVNPFYGLVSGSTIVTSGPPTVSIYFPTNHTALPVTNAVITNVVLEIDAVTTSYTNIQKVEFYTNNVLFTTITSSPFTTYWTNPPSGAQVLKAKAYDASSSHLSANSATVTVDVGGPSMQLSPTNSCAGLSNTVFTAMATLLSSTGTPINGSNVTFAVTGAQNFTTNIVTDSSGHALLVYTGTNAGTDHIVASATVNGQLAQSPAALKAWAYNIGCSTTTAGTLAESDGFSIGCGCAPSHYADFYAITGNSGDVITLTMQSASFSGFMFVMNTNCSNLSVTNEQLDLTRTRVSFTLPSNGTYVVEATSTDVFKTGDYTLQIACGARPTAPDIGVLISGANFTNYGSFNMGTTTNGTALTVAITVTNTGTADLILGGYSFGLSNVYSISPAPTSTITPAHSATFTVQFLANSSGQYTSYLALTNNDPDKSLFVINFTAVSTADGTPPTVAISAPTNNTHFITPATVAISAQATAAGANTITNVVFLFRTAQGTFVIGTNTAAPYSIVWNAPGAGTYALLAVAYDSQGRVAMSSPVNVEVDGGTQNHAPITMTDRPVVLANSVNNVIDVLANDSDPDGDALTITDIIPPSDSNQHGTAQIIENGKKIRYTPPPNFRSYDINNPADGFSYRISDGKGGTALGGVYVVILGADIPSITITNPPDGSTLLAGTPTNLTVSISPLQYVTRVDYYNGSDLIGSVTNAPFTNFPWIVRADTCNCGIYAAATDQFGQRGVSPTVHYTISIPTNVALPFAQIDSPALLPFDVIGGTSSQSAMVQEGLMVITGSVYQVLGDVKTAAEYKVLIETPDGTILRDSGWRPAALIQDDTIYTNDLTTLQNDKYQLELLVRNDYQTTSKKVPFILDSNLKIGVFAFSQQDFAIPAGGIPLAVVRTYNSMNPRLGDFGYSWTYALNELDVTFDEIRVPQCPLDVFEEGPAHTGRDFSLRVSGSRDVSMTLPDGRHTTFLYYEQACGCHVGGDFCACPTYYSPPSVHYNLRPADENAGDVGGYDVFFNKWEKAGGETPHDAFDFPAFVLTDENDGTEYFIKRDYQGTFTFLAGDCNGESGNYYEITDDGFYVKAYGAAYLAWIKKPSGEKIVINPPTFNNGGSQFSIDFFNAAEQKTRSIYFVRNANGQIVSANDPIGGPSGLPMVKYEYDGNTNLTKVSRLVDRNTQTYSTNTYLYEDANFPHFLTRILDARGVPVARNVYDDTGKLIGIVDARGKTNLFVHDLNGRTETVFDRMGNPTIHTYDNRGNVTTTIDALGAVARLTYDDNNFVSSFTDALSNVMYYAHDSTGNQTMIADGVGRTNLFAYTNGKLQQYTDPVGNFTENQYDGGGRLLATLQHDAQGNVLQQVSSSYDAAGHLVESRVGGQTMATYGYDDSGNINAATNQSGFVRTFSHDGNGNQTGGTCQTRKPDGSIATVTTTTEFNAALQVTSAVDPNGNTNRAFYTSAGQLDYTVDKFGNTNSFLYDARGALIQMVSPFGTNATVYDDNGRPVLASDLNGITGTQTDYDAVGHVLRTIRRINVRIDIVADALNAGQWESVVGTWGTPVWTNSSEYNANGSLKSQTDATGNTTTFDYYPDGQVKTVTDPLGHRTDYFYDDAGRQSAIVDALFHETRMEYDALGRQVRTIYADGTSLTNEYNAAGEKAALVDQLGVRTQLGYSVSGLLTNIIQPTVLDGAHGNAQVNPAWNYTYDEQGHLLVVTDANGHSTTNKFDEFGRQYATALPLGKTNWTEYNTKGQIWKIHDFKGQITELVYDQFGRAKAKFLFNQNSLSPSNSVCYQYNSLGQLSRVTERFGNDASTNTCDGYVALVGPPIRQPQGQFRVALARVPSEAQGAALGVIFLALVIAFIPTEKRRQFISSIRDAWPEFQEAPAKRLRLRLPAWIWRPVNFLMIVVLLTSDGRFGLVSMANAQCTIPSNASTPTTRISDLTYDVYGNLTQVNSPEGVINYSYDPVTGQRTDTCTANSEFGYRYDALGRLSTITVYKRNGAAVVPPEQFTYTYDAIGNRSTLTLPNGIVSTWQYDSLNRLTNLVHQSGTLTLAQYDYHLDVTGQKTNTSERILLPDSTYRTNNISWAYDQVSRLTNEVSTSTAASGKYTNSYSYDKVGNRSQKTVIAGTSTTTTTYTYDDNDQLLQDITTVSGVPTTNLYSYDANASLTNKTSAAGTIAYFYDLKNKLSATTVGGTTTSYLYNDGGFRVQSSGTAGTTNYLSDANNPSGFEQTIEELSGAGGTPIRSYTIGDSILSQASVNTWYLLPDGHGSKRQVADGPTSIRSQYNFDAYGVSLVDLGNNPDTTHLFSGEQFDPTLQMYNLRARFYSAGTGRFNSRDSFKGNKYDPESLHRYLYTGGNPVNRVDPSGHESEAEMLVVTGIESFLAELDLGAICETIKGIREFEKALFPLVPITAAQVPGFHKEMAHLCYDSYNAKGLITPTWAEASPAELTNLGLPLQSTPLWQDTSFFARLYINHASNKYALAFRGTSTSPASWQDQLGDWLSNIGQGALGPLVHTQYDQATALADQVSAALGDHNLTMTGHSLGGGLASAAAFETDRPCVTFNAAALNELTWLYYGGFLYTEDMVNYSVKGEMLTTLQRAIWLAPPTTFCQQYQLNPAPQDAGLSMIGLHSMVTVLHALNEPVP